MWLQFYQRLYRTSQKWKKKKILSIYSLYFINNIFDKVSQIINKTNISNNKFSLYTIMINFNLIIYKNHANKFLLEKKRNKFLFEILF